MPRQSDTPHKYSHTLGYVSVRLQLPIIHHEGEDSRCHLYILYFLSQILLSVSALLVIVSGEADPYHVANPSAHTAGRLAAVSRYVASMTKG